MAVSSDHTFTATILEILAAHFGQDAEAILRASPLLTYLNIKTKSAGRGSKARGAFANHYALYVIVEDYIRNGFEVGRAGSYSKYEGARFSDLFRRQRELPFGAKLQNHALNSRLNDEFRKYFPTLDKFPIVRDVARQRYWIQEDLLFVQADRKSATHNIATVVLEIIDAYVASKRAAFESFLEACRKIALLSQEQPEEAVAFVTEQLQPNVDARVFEIVSFAVLKARYGAKSVWLGDRQDEVSEHSLVLYKTGRTNANDGGIDFVMRPLGRFFQVTETVDATKYFLDIDKIQRFPITFVVKSLLHPDTLREAIRQKAVERYKVDAVVEAYMAAVEEVINASELLDSFREVVSQGGLPKVMEEIIHQSMVEFNHDGEDFAGDDAAVEESS